jgi:hypothetical protein
MEIILLKDNLKNELLSATKLPARGKKKKI